MSRVRITGLPPLLTALGLTALVMAGLGAAVALWSQRASASRLAPDPAAPPRCSAQNPCLAVIIDDVGRDLPALRELLALPLDLTFSVLPHARHTEPSLRAIRRAGREILLHLPMAPADPSRITDERVVLGREGPLEHAMAACLGRVPDAVGANNHMGSALSRDSIAATRILRGLRHRGLWFLDSRTTGESTFCAHARPLGVPCIERDVFLDDPPLSESARRQLRLALQLARQRGRAVAIAHPLPMTVELLRGLDRSTMLGRVRIRRLSGLVDGT